MSKSHELAVLEAALMVAKGHHDRCRGEFDAAHDAVVLLLERRRSGEFVGKAEMLAGYDRRMMAGVAWQPFRARYNGLRRVLDAARSEAGRVVAGKSASGLEDDP